MSLNELFTLFAENVGKLDNKFIEIYKVFTIILCGTNFSVGW